MLRYTVRKLVLAVPLLWGVVTLIFVLLELSPGDYSDKFLNPELSPLVRENVCAKFHCHDPAWVRYLALLRNMVHLDFGVSMSQERPVFDIIAEALPNTIQLSLVTLAVVYPVGIAIGTLQAVRHNSAVDSTLSVSSLFLYSMPAFWLALMLQLFVSFYLGGWIEHRFGTSGLGLLALPSSDMKDAITYDYLSTPQQAVDRLRHLVLPGIAMGLASSASTARYVRSSVLEVIRQDYIRTARAKGLPERTVILRHALRNALLPIITLFGLSVPYLFSGTVLVETIFAWPGMGRLIVSAILSQDTPLIIACFFVSTCLVVAGNLLADLAYAWADPRIRLEG